MKPPKKAGGSAGQAGVAGWQNGATPGTANGGTRSSSNDARDYGGATSGGGTTTNTASIGGGNEGGATTDKDATEMVGGAGTSSGTSASGIGGVSTVLSPSGGITGSGGTVTIAGSPSMGGTPPMGGVFPSGGGPIGGATLTGDTRATGGAAPTGGKPGTGGEPPSCVGLAKCGADSCCTSLRMDGGTFKMGRSLSGTDAYSSGSGAELPEHDATVSAFALDKYEVTVGRFREFVENYTAWRNGGNPKVGDGKNGNVEAASREKTGWGQSWTEDPLNPVLPRNADALKAVLNPDTNCNWTPNAGTDAEETYPMNCVSWYEAFAFCVWDGGRLPTEAEWEYAAAGGQANRLYPWAGTTIDKTRANYVDSANTAKKAVGSYPAGVGVFGHMDLAGSMWEWVFDWYNPDDYGTPVSPVNCNNCANTTPSSGRVLRGGGWDYNAIDLRAANRVIFSPGNRGRSLGFRCARPTQ